MSGVGTRMSKRSISAVARSRSGRFRRIPATLYGAASAADGRPCPLGPRPVEGTATQDVTALPSLGEQAYEELRSAIVTQRLPSGTPLVEADVTTSLGVSRTPVREALRRLELEGYLERDDSSRLFVRRMTVEQLDEAFVVRELLEAFATRLAAERIADAELERLDILLAADVAALEAGDVEELARLNEQIHGVVREASRNRTLSQVLRALRGRVFGLTAFAVGSTDD
jgi:DNA-binding GntR family transcriptional regulator